MMKLLVIADDFTGALDTGVQFAEKGVSTKVLKQSSLTGAELKAVQTEVLVIDTETRHIDGDQAYEIVYQIVDAAKHSSIPYIYKKTDSGLRGNVGKELEAALAAGGSEYLTFIPAMPSMNRITVNGVHYIDGVPIHESAFGRDLFEPVKSPYIRDLFRQSRAAVNLYPESDHYVRPKGREIGVFDAATEADIERIARDLMAQKKMGIMAGCAGFASVLCQMLPLKGGQTGFAAVRKKLFIACGSISEISREQVEYAEKHGMYRVTMTPSQQLTPGYLDSEEGKRWLENLKGKCDAGYTCIVETGISNPERVIRYIGMKGIPLEEARVMISDTLGSVLKHLLELGLDAVIMIVGGDTLAGFIDSMNGREIIVYQEIEQGTVLSSMKLDGREQWIISKSGGFGGPGLFVDMEERIRGDRRIQYDKTVYA